PETPRRRLAGLHFERVLGVRTRGLTLGDASLSLLAITFEETEDAARCRPSAPEKSNGRPSARRAGAIPSASRGLPALASGFSGGRVRSRPSAPVESVCPVSPRPVRFDRVGSNRAGPTRITT
ncbi:DUF2948 family protein, partial [Methylobacterium sp. WL93]